MTVREVAEQLNLSRPTVRKYLRLCGAEVLVLSGKWLVPVAGYMQLCEYLANNSEEQGQEQGLSE